MNRQEHLEWCKRRALEYVDRGELTDAFASMASDLNKHPETEKHPGIVVGMGLLMTKQLDTEDKMRKFIEGFN
jgi:hypothetical protein